MTRVLEKKPHPKKKQITKVFHYYFRLLCIDYKICSVDYFLDDMKMYELTYVLSSLPYTEKDRWEMTRFIGYIIAQVNSKKKFKPEDILALPWDDDNKEYGIDEDFAKSLLANAKNI